MARNGGLGWLVKLALLAVVAYFAYTEALPWMQQNLRWKGVPGSLAKGGGKGSECVRLAAAASASFGNGLRDFAPPYDLHAWDSFMVTMEERRSQAESGCRCSLQSCDLGTEALEKLGELIDELDLTVRSQIRTVPNPARRQGEIDALLDEARALARRGK